MEWLVKVVKITWPLVALVGIGVAALLALFALIPAGEPELRTALVTMVTTLSVGAMGVFTHNAIQKLSSKVGQIERHVNGNTTELIRRLPEGAAEGIERRVGEGS